VPSGYHPSTAPFDRDPEHPLNRVYRALFVRQAHVSVPKCSLSGDPGGCRKLSPSQLLGGEGEVVEREVGHDEPTPLMRGDVEHLTDPERASRATSALRDAKAHAVRATPLARVLLQNDLWERYDAIGALLDAGHAASALLRPLQREIAELMRALALSRAELLALPSNQAEIAAAHPELLPEFATEAGWLEVRTISAEKPHDEPTLRGTRHSDLAGHRIAFRVLARIAPDQGGPAWLARRLATEPHATLPVGSRLALVGSPLAISREGDIVAPPLILLIEIRAAQPETQRLLTLDDPALDVLEGRRELLLRTPRPAGGLERLAPDALIPTGATCAPHPGVLVPMRSTCMQCHAGAGARLTGPMRHGPTRFEVEEDRTAAARTAAEKKATEPRFRELAAVIRGGS
jgi:hypothetical protein